jgi:hypothetical protein
VTPLVCTGGRRIPTTCGADQGSRKDDVLARTPARRDWKAGKGGHVVEPFKQVPRRIRNG